MARRRIYVVVAGVSVLGAASWRTEAAASTGSEIKAEGHSLRRRAAGATRRWRDEHGDGEGRDTDVRTRDSGDTVEIEAIPPPLPPKVTVCSRTHRDPTHDRAIRNDGSETDDTRAHGYVTFETIEISSSLVSADTLLGPCSDHCDVLCGEAVNGGVKDLCSVYSCNEDDNSCSAVTKCPPSLPDNPDGYCNPETGECGRDGPGFVSPNPPTQPDSGVGLISTATSASSCNQDAFLPVDMEKEKRKLKRARKRWRLASAKRPYSYRVSEKSSPFYRSTKKKTKIETVFREINQIFKKVELYYNFSIIYNRKTGYPKTVRLGYISPEDPRCVDIDLRIKRLRFSRPVDPCDPINQRTFDTQEALSELKANQLKFNDLQDYTYTISRNCFCPEEFRGPFRVTVLGGEISAATYEETTQAVDLADHSIPTIVELFDLINQACTTPTAGLSVVYDAEMGYPASLYIDQNECIADEETSYSVSDLNKIATDSGFLGGGGEQIRECDKPTYDTEEALAALVTNRLKFNDLQDYDFTYTPSSFWARPEARGPFLVSVRDGNITAVTNEYTNSSVDPKEYRIQTIKDLFDTINDALTKPMYGTQQATTLNVTYNALLGYPERIFIDRFGCAYDDEVHFSASKLVDRTPKIGGPVVPGGPDGPGLTFKSPLDEARENQLKWDAFLATNGSKSYIFTYREDSLFEEDQTITVIGGTPEKVSAFNYGFSLVPIDIANSRAIQSIEGAFILLVETLEVGQGITPLIVYDPKQGNPSSVSLSFISGERAGERISFTISDVKLLPTDDGCRGNALFDECPNEGLSCYEEAGCCVESRRVSSKCDCRFGRWDCGYTEICMTKPDENRTEPHC